MKTKEKEIVLKQFEEKMLDILIATNVIEEGIDLPEVNILVIENAERFGLSQLYQLTGRIGRTGKKAFCFLISHLPTKKSAQRIKALLTSENAFELAEKDLEIRGPGELLGERQTGKLNLKIAKLTDLRLIELARQKAKEILKRDPEFFRHCLVSEKEDKLIPFRPFFQEKPQHGREVGEAYNLDSLIKVVKKTWFDHEK